MATSNMQDFQNTRVEKKKKQDSSALISLILYIYIYIRKNIEKLHKIIFGLNTRKIYESEDRYI